MKHQLQTIRAAIELATPHYQADTERFKQALTALSELERMAVDQVQLDHLACIDDGELRYVTGRKAPAYDCELYAMPDGKRAPKLYATPPAQQPQYEAGDMASAAAQGFRDGVASVAQQPPKLEDIEQYRMQMAGISTAAMGYWKEGDSIHPDYDTPALRDVAKLYAQYDALYKAQQPQAECRSDGRCQYAIDHGAEGLGHCPEGRCAMKQPQAEVAEVFYCKTCGTAMQMPHDDCLACERGESQQPKARPDFNDEWTGYLKDGETPFERFLRERKDLQSVLKLYQRVLEENERLKGQQPQAGTVPEGYRIVPDWKGYALLGSGRYLINHAANYDPELGAELIITLATEKDREGGRKIGESRPNPEDLPPVQPEEMVIRIGFLNGDALFVLEDQLADVRKVLESAGKAAPQQAEAVPPGYVLVPVEPTDSMFFDPDEVCVNFKETPWSAFCRIYKSMLDAAIDAAIAAGKGEG